MEGERAALFQHAQSLLHEHEFILLRAYFVKDKVADNSVEMIVGKVEFCCVAVLKCAAICDTLGGSVCLALRLSVVPHRRPVVDALHLGEWEAFRRRNAQCTRAAADLKHSTKSVPRELIEQVGVDAAHEPAALEVEDAAAVVHIEDDDGRDEGEDGKDEEGCGHAVIYERIECGEYIEYARDCCEGFHHRGRDPVAVVRFHSSVSLFSPAITSSTSRLTSARNSLSTGVNAASFTP